MNFSPSPRSQEYQEGTGRWGSITRSGCSYRQAAHPVPGRIWLGKGRNCSQPMKSTRDLIIVNYFMWKMLDTLAVGKRHREGEEGKESTISLEICWETNRFPSGAV